jgi:hypothetical protein
MSLPLPISCQIARFCSVIAVLPPSTASMLVVTEHVAPIVVAAVAVHGTLKAGTTSCVVPLAENPTPIGPLFLSVTRNAASARRLPV